MVTNTINLAERFARSDRFKTLFGDGMSLVENSASYLDGPGREAAKSLPQSVALFYGAESMRLTTRLMQIASWLLLQRAANEGEMTREQLLDEKKKVVLEAAKAPAANEAWDALPDDFKALVMKSISLQSRVYKIDSELYGERIWQDEKANNPINQQIELLSTAFGARRSS
ncbi:MAG: DUF1465 family protein [Rhizobiaceae bacterium]|nr:DUF1465 family protein [Rhizobiaceae bacterium]